MRLRYPGATRPWQFVLEPLYGYLLLAERLVSAPHKAPPTVNFGPSPRACVPVADVVDRVLSLWGEGTWDREPVPQPPEAQTLMLDASRAGERLGWQPRLDLDTSLGWTVEWWAARRDGINLRKVAERQIESYEKMIES